MDYRTFFTKTTHLSAPFDYQFRIAEQAWPDILDVPTGMGKTAAVTLAWLWKRGWRQGNRSEVADVATPRRLIWCLPMRVLVEQTEENIRRWLDTLGILGQIGEGKVSVHVLMGGADDTDWASFPEEDMILIGTQDMLLSRALMRGYGMSRYQWPIHFALLHNDCLWVFDEVQLMGAGLATSAQLEAFRRSFPMSKGSRSLWVSATLNRNWLDTVDLKPHLDGLKTLGLDAADRQQAGDRLHSVKTVAKLPIAFGKDAGNKKGLDAYIQALCEEVLKAHVADSQTIVILNRVDRAQRLFCLLRKARPEKANILIHARFRAAERRKQNQLLRDCEKEIDRIVVATQAIEAGVDISSRVLITELAPWSSLVQRFGRCNRYGEHNAKGAKILWIDINDDKEALKPYDSVQVAEARRHMANLTSASPQDLPASGEARPLTAVLRRKDLLDLFNTDPDLSGFDVDVSDYIRDNEQPGVQVFWRDFEGSPNEPKPQDGPIRDELCPISMGQAQDIYKYKRAWHWDALEDEWARLDRPPRPGMTLLLKASDVRYDAKVGFDAQWNNCDALDILDGGYDAEVGFDASSKKAVSVIPIASTRENSFLEDPESQQDITVTLVDHLGHTGKEMMQLCSAIDETTYAPVLHRAALWHDIGKAHEVYRTRCGLEEGDVSLAKSPNYNWRVKHKSNRTIFRHELASALAWLAQHNGETDADLIAYIIAAHHGKVRMSLRAMPTEEPAPDGRRFARGVWEGDPLQALDFHGEHSREIVLSLALMELGEGEQGPSWAARTLKLLEEHGPFRLAWLETLVRLADRRASREEQHMEEQERA
jgi:CRISPR-associated endonuclease/helicase Cas3